MTLLATTHQAPHGNQRYPGGQDRPRHARHPCHHRIPGPPPGRPRQQHTHSQRQAHRHPRGAGRDPARPPEHADTIGRVLALPTRRRTQPVVQFLTIEETEALLSAPDAATFTGALLSRAAQTGRSGLTWTYVLMLCGVPGSLRPCRRARPCGYPSAIDWTRSVTVQLPARTPRPSWRQRSTTPCGSQDPDRHSAPAIVGREACGWSRIPVVPACSSLPIHSGVPLPCLYRAATRPNEASSAHTWHRAQMSVPAAQDAATVVEKRAGEGTRTPNHLFTRQVRYQLRHASLGTATGECIHDAHSFRPSISDRRGTHGQPPGA